MYAQDTLSTNPLQRMAMVLVTDGEPDACSSSLANVSLELAKADQLNIPTYVIGVGTDLTSLDQLAMAGGTTAPTLVAVGDPATTKTQFLDRARRHSRSGAVMRLPNPARAQGNDH